MSNIITNELIVIKGNLENLLVPVKSILPAHVSYDRFTNAAAVALANNNDLQNADPQSLINALTSCAKDGLIPDNREAALVIYKKKDSEGNYYQAAQYMPMIDGVMKRARQSGEIALIAARAVYENDTFRVWLDDNGEHIHYEPTLKARGEMMGAVSYARMKSGEFQFEWLNIDDIEKVRAASKNSNTGPWKDWYESMARKSAAHRLCRRLPNNSEIMEMLERGTEMVWQQEKDITPAADRVVLSELASAAPPADPVPTKATSEAPAPAATPEPAAPPEESAIAQQLRDDIQKVDTPECARKLGDLITSKKAELGIALFTELKNKAVKRHHALKAISAINAKFDELSPEMPNAAQKFNDLLALINKSQRFLDPAEFERFSVAAEDMRAEYGM